MTSRKKNLSLRTLRALAVMLPLAVAALIPSTASAQTTAEDVIVYAGQQGASMYEQSLAGVLYTENQIGLMADRILWTEGQIGEMADRIVYVTEISQDGFIEVTYMVTGLIALGMENGGYTYQVMLMPVAALPAGW